MPTVSQGGADKRKGKGTTHCCGADSPADSRHWEHHLGLCDEVTALQPPAAESRQGWVPGGTWCSSVPPWLLCLWRGGVLWQTGSLCPQNLSVLPPQTSPVSKMPLVHRGVSTAHQAAPGMLGLQGGILQSCHCPPSATKQHKTNKADTGLIKRVLAEWCWLFINGPHQ